MRKISFHPISCRQDSDQGQPSIDFSFSLLYTDKKEREKILIYKEIPKGAVAKSYMTNGLLIYE
jgi:hypothetical protein